jgi:hypothetical protein
LAFWIWLKGSDKGISRLRKGISKPDQQIHQIAKLEPISYTRVAILATFYCDYVHGEPLAGYRQSQERFGTDLAESIEVFPTGFPNNEPN